MFALIFRRRRPQSSDLLFGVGISWNNYSDWKGMSMYIVVLRGFIGGRCHSCLTVSKCERISQKQCFPQIFRICESPRIPKKLLRHTSDAGLMKKVSTEPVPFPAVPICSSLSLSLASLPVSDTSLSSTNGGRPVSVPPPDKRHGAAANEMASVVTLTVSYLSRRGVPYDQGYYCLAHLHLVALSSGFPPSTPLSRNSNNNHNNKYLSFHTPVSAEEKQK